MAFESLAANLNWLLPEQATRPIGQPTNLPVPDISAPSQVKAESVSTMGDLMESVGSIFDFGWGIYEKVTGRVTANEQIKKDTEPQTITQVIVKSGKGFYQFYEENKMAVIAIGGGFIFLTFALLAKKLGIIKR